MLQKLGRTFYHGGPWSTMEHHGGHGGPWRTMEEKKDHGGIFYILQKNFDYTLILFYKQRGNFQPLEFFQNLQVIAKPLLIFLSKIQTLLLIQI